MSVRLLVWGVLAGVAAAAAADGLASTKAEKRRQAEQLVSEALSREVYGQSRERDQLLEEAAALAPDFAPAFWHRGFVRSGGDWIKADASPRLAEEDRRLDAYRHKRGEAADSIEGQMTLANWCRDRNLPDHERAHLHRVLELNRDHAEARARLGFRRLGGEWASPQDIVDAAKQAAAIQNSMTIWGPKLEKTLEGLAGRGERLRAASIARVREINSAEAIPAMERILSPHSEEAALLVVEVLGDITDLEATRSLARHAMMSPWEPVRKSAAERLRSRPQEDYVPAMLAEMYSPVRSQTNVTTGAGGRLLYRHSFVREGQKQNEQMVLDTAYTRVKQPGGDREETLARAMNNLWMSAVNRELAVEQQNRAQSEMNDRITTALNSATGANQPNAPDKWWKWWNEQNEVFLQGEKPVSTIQTAQEVYVSDRIDPSLLTGGGSGGGEQYALDCLVAGTPVWTATGVVAVEQLQVGDMVLAQDPETGELAYKPVLRTTVRPEGKLIRVLAGTETIETSGGHLFWVAGEGWVKARKLQSGQELHGLRGSVRVSAIEEGNTAKTYNVEVAEFHNYFVGQEKILCHDNTVKSPTAAILPGLVEK
jgi:hypothetical protein